MSQCEFWIGARATVVKHLARGFLPRSTPYQKTDIFRSPGVARGFIRRNWQLRSMWSTRFQVSAMNLCLYPSLPVGLLTIAPSS